MERETTDDQSANFKTGISLAGPDLYDSFVREIKNRKIDE